MFRMPKEKAAKLVDDGFEASADKCKRKNPGDSRQPRVRRRERIIESRKESILTTPHVNERRLRVSLRHRSPARAWNALRSAYDCVRSVTKTLEA
jgi:hypothetical protein